MTQPLISLCLITGNAEEYISRCLTSFAPIADEIIVVRAIGNATPDKTLDIAREQFGAITAEYRNAPENADWPHVDDFAAARNMSFDLASGRYCFWCDTDDILLSGAAEIREHAERHEYAVHIFPYRIQPLGVEVPRERLILRGSGRWKYPVHECFRFPVHPVAGMQDERVVISHQPLSSKTGSNERNLRILRAMPPESMNAGLLYHMHGELLALGDLPGAIGAFKRALETGDLGKAEQYEMLLNLSRATDDEEQRMACLHQAYAADPTRREALGVLAGTAMDHGKPELGLTYALQMRATPLPKGQEWNHRKSFYGWIGDDVFEQALRATGNDMAAEEFRVERLKKHGGAQIALIHATRGRPQMAVNTRKFWFDFADKPERIEHLFIFDTDDTDSHALRRLHHLEIPSGGGCVAAWNFGAYHTTAPVIVQLSDDFLPFPGWDTAILERLGDVTKPAVLAVSDGFRTDRLLCMAICTRRYLQEDYFLFHPWFTGVYSDDWFTECAYKRGMVIEARDLVFEHRHPLKLGTAPDETYLMQNAPERYREGQAIIARLRAGTDFSSVPGFLNYWMFYREVAHALADGDTAVEVGVWLGRSFIFLIQETQRLGKAVKFVAVDTFKGEEGQTAHEATVAAHGGSLLTAFRANLDRCLTGADITIQQDDSAAAASAHADGSLAFVFIDAAHDYDSVIRDVRAWLPKVKRGGMIAGHDAQHEPVMRAIGELLPQANIALPVWYYRIP